MLWLCYDSPAPLKALIDSDLKLLPHLLTGLLHHAAAAEAHELHIRTSPAGKSANALTEAYSIALEATAQHAAVCADSPRLMEVVLQLVQHCIFSLHRHIGLQQPQLASEVQECGPSSRASLALLAAISALLAILPANAVTASQPDCPKCTAAAQPLASKLVNLQQLLQPLISLALQKQVQPLWFQPCCHLNARLCLMGLKPVSGEQRSSRNSAASATSSNSAAPATFRATSAQTQCASDHISKHHHGEISSADDGSPACTDSGAVAASPSDVHPAAEQPAAATQCKHSHVSNQILAGIWWEMATELPAPASSPQQQDLPCPPASQRSVTDQVSRSAIKFCTAIDFDPADGSACLGCISAQLAAQAIALRLGAVSSWQQPSLTAFPLHQSQLAEEAEPLQKQVHQDPIQKLLGTLALHPLSMAVQFWEMLTIAAGQSFLPDLADASKALQLPGKLAQQEWQVNAECCWFRA